MCLTTSSYSGYKRGITTNKLAITTNLVLNLKRGQVIAITFLIVRYSHHIVPMSLWFTTFSHPTSSSPSPYIRPILRTLPLSQLHTLGNHDNYQHMFFPQHPPEVRHSTVLRPCRQWVSINMHHNLMTVIVAPFRCQGKKNSYL